MSAEAAQLARDIRQSAMDLLARREHGFKELARKLSVRFAQGAVLEVLTCLREERLQNDERFVESYIYSRRQRGYGPIRIRSELLQKGVEDELIAQYLSGQEDDQWMELAKEVKERKFGTAPPLDKKERARCSRFLARRGFSAGQISAAFSGQKL